MNEDDRLEADTKLADAMRAWLEAYDVDGPTDDMVDSMFGGCRQALKDDWDVTLPGDPDA